MRRREFITLLGGAFADQAMPANAQEPVRVRTVGALMGFANDAEAKARTEAFQQGLQREGWSVGHNLRIEYRYAEGDTARMQALLPKPRLGRNRSHGLRQSSSWPLVCPFIIFDARSGTSSSLG
jgi:hypothetical protein